MEREKGATATDKAAHKVFDTKLYRQTVGVYCPRCGCELRTAYHEERLYSVECRVCGTNTLVQARNPVAAAEKVGIKAQPADDWHEEYGEVLWWHFPIEEPPVVGSPISYNPDGSPTVPDYCTHWTPIYCPRPPEKED